MMSMINVKTIELTNTMDIKKLYKVNSNKDIELKINPEKLNNFLLVIYKCKNYNQFNKYYEKCDIFDYKEMCCDHHIVINNSIGLSNSFRDDLRIYIHEIMPQYAIYKKRNPYY